MYYKLIKGILQQHIEAYYFYPNELDLDTRDRTGYWFKQHHRPTTAHTSSKHVPSAILHILFLSAIWTWDCSVTSSFLLLVLCQRLPQHKQPQLTPQINHYKSNIFNLPLEPYGLHVTTAEGPCSRAALAFWWQSHLLSWWVLVLSACRRLPGQQAQHTALTLPPVCMSQQGWVTSPSPIYHDRNPPVKSGFN